MPPIANTGANMTLTIHLMTLPPSLSDPITELTSTNRSLGNASRLNEVEYQTPILAHIFMAVYVLFGVLIAVFNTLTIVAIVKCPELKTVTNMFVLSLSCADLILSPTLVFIHFLPNALFVVGVSGTRIMAECLFTLMFTSSGTSLLSILAIAVDRYVAVIHPYSYKQIMTPKRATLVIALIWLYVTVFMASLIAYYLWQADPRVFFHLSFITAIIPRPVYAGAIVSQILICIVASVALYTKIFVAIRKRHHESLTQRSRNQHLKTAQARRITNTMALVLGALIVSWSPYAAFSATLTNEILYKYEWTVYASMFSILLLYANSFMNPVIYAARSQAFRRAYWRMMCCTCVSNPVSPGYINVDTPISDSVKSTKESITEATVQNGRSDTTEI